MSVVNEIEAIAISSFVDILGHGSIFTRIVDEIHRANEALPDASGKDKMNRVVADLEIIFADLVEPVAKRVLNLLIELGVSYLAALNPIAGQVASAVAGMAEAKINGD